MQQQQIATPHNLAVHAGRKLMPLTNCSPNSSTSPNHAIFIIPSVIILYPNVLASMFFRLVKHAHWTLRRNVLHSSRGVIVMGNWSRMTFKRFASIYKDNLSNFLRAHMEKIMSVSHLIPADFVNRKLSTISETDLSGWMSFICVHPTGLRRSAVISRCFMKAESNT